MEFTQLPSSKTANQALETKGYAVVEEFVKELVKVFLLELGILKESHGAFYKLSVDGVKDSIPLIIICKATHGGLELAFKSIKTHAWTFFVLLRRGKYNSIIRQLVNTYLDEFHHLLRQWDFLPLEDDCSPGSVQRYLESFKIPEFVHMAVEPPWSKRLSSKLVASNLAMASQKRSALAGPDTPSKECSVFWSRKFAFDDVEEAEPKEAQHQQNLGVLDSAG
ncbi:hypothetical protein BT96DRAFT_1001053 [Gymnopus androsaceus JB14]|uniref:Uncharacterized protein n=1 Tax=Gymnopus androsaceus JB14 TaxID=1447944 RepID=A0A6A4H1P8_9AGAR|nr:hypothetical protein BT96DRAFT_1001053 [Gymnopus androsaceus JB14]